jgi:hypothetical protein
MMNAFQNMDLVSEKLPPVENQNWHCRQSHALGMQSSAVHETILPPKLPGFLSDHPPCCHCILLTETCHINVSLGCFSNKQISPVLWTLRAQDKSGSNNNNDNDDLDNGSNWDSNSSSSSLSGNFDNNSLPAAGGAQLKGRALWLKRALVVKAKVKRDKVSWSEERKRIKEEAARLRVQHEEERAPDWRG